VIEAADPNTGGSIGPHNQYSNNCVSMAEAWGLSVSTHVNDSPGTPGCVDYQPDGSGDYHLTDGSWCTDQGIASLGGVAAPPTDFDGMSRPAGPAIDIGPYERTNTLAPAQMWNPARADNRIALNGVTAAAVSASWIYAPLFTSYAATSGKYYWETEVDTTDIWDISVGIGNIGRRDCRWSVFGKRWQLVRLFYLRPSIFQWLDHDTFGTLCLGCEATPRARPRLPPVLGAGRAERELEQQQQRQPGDRQRRLCLAGLLLGEPGWARGQSRYPIGHGDRLFHAAIVDRDGSVTSEDDRHRPARPQRQPLPRNSLGYYRRVPLRAADLSGADERRPRAISRRHQN
jgi:hypothetical protein